MEHRHLIGDVLSLAAIDDIIERGRRNDWARLGQAALSDPHREVLRKIERVCTARRLNAESAGEFRNQSFAAWECFISRLKER